MILLSLVAVSIVLIGLQCSRLTAKVAPCFRPTDLFPPERMRALLEEVRRERAAQEHNPVECG
jgi:hypothetical protein